MAKKTQRKKPHGRTRAQRQAAQTAQLKKRVLEAYAECGTVTYAARTAGVGRRTIYDWLEHDPDFARDFDEAGEEAVDSLEKEARRRALDGVVEPVGFHQGVAGEYVRRYSDTLLIFLLKGARPEKYKDRHEHTGAGGGPIQHDHRLDKGRVDAVLDAAPVPPAKKPRSRR